MLKCFPLQQRALTMILEESTETRSRGQYECQPEDWVVLLVIQISGRTVRSILGIQEPADIRM